ncbi:MAG: sigma 54-interacting transcriptional regulator [Myxococcaceae bacterium]|nr:sigma 54-interacting transcriptional regulator [Myxococcaceae bacterium]
MARELASLWREHEDAAGRTAELGLLERELDEARAAGRARFVFVRGAAGVGKSHLLASFRRVVGQQGIPVFESESPREGRRPFGLFAGVVREMLDFAAHGGTAPAQLLSLRERLLPLLGPSAAGPGGGEGRLLLCEAAVELLVLVGRARPVVLMHDVDAADPASLELLRYVAAVASAPLSPVEGLLVLSLRDAAELPAPLAEVLQRVPARTVPLAGLDVEGIRAFLSRPGVAERLLDATGGVPEALEALLARTEPRPAELLLHRAARLPEASRTLLELLAVAPGAQRVEVLGAALAALGHAGADAAAALDALTRAHLVVGRLRSGSLAYRLVREGDRHTLGASVAEPRGRALKAALGRALAEAGEWVEAAVLLQEAAAGAEAVEVASRAAAQLKARGALEDAAELYGRLLASLPGREERAEVHLHLADLAEEQGDFRRALSHLGRARDRSRPVEQTAAHALRAARALLRLGRLRLCERMLVLAHEGASAARQAEVWALKAELAVLRGRPEEAVSLAAQALPALSPFPEAAYGLRNAVGKAHLVRGELGRAEAVFAHNLTQARAAGQRPQVSQALLNLGVTAHRKGERERAIQLYQEGLADARRPAQAQALANLGILYAEGGDFEPALEHLSRALHAFSRLASAREVALAASNLARLQLLLGETPCAAELAEHALRVAGEVGEPYLLASARLTLGEVALEGGEGREAARRLLEAREGFEVVGSDGQAALAAALKARAHLLLGERAQAGAELLRPAVERGAAVLAAAGLEVELARGELALGLGELLEAGKAAARAREALLRQPDLEGPSRVHFLFARLRQAAGDVDGAQAELGRAARALEALAQRLAPHRRRAFLAVPRRAELLNAAGPASPLPRVRAVNPLPPVELPAGHGLVGSAPALVRVLKQLEPVARSNTTVLVRGESGTGKELLADALHALSPRRAMPLVKVNCAAMVEELLLSELFGHEKGAFTGAVRERKGRFELADGGTLFLDEIGDISPKCQVALLRVLQEREFERVGGTRTLRVDVRVLCATHRDLEGLVAEGRFRQDLYYRLRGVSLELPPLRARLEDLPLLARHVLARVARERGEPERRLAPEALALLARHSWPGNVRELENVLASAALFAQGELIGTEAFATVPELAALLEEREPDAPAPADTVATTPADRTSANEVDFYALVRDRGMSLRTLQDALERQCIERALNDASGNISEAARLLGMKRSRLSQIVNADERLRALAHGEA